MDSEKMEHEDVGPGPEASSFKILLRDYNKRMVEAWREAFSGDEYKNIVEVSEKTWPTIKHS